MMNYKVLYIYKRKEPVSRILRSLMPKYFWTMCSADTEYCRTEYRPKAQIKYCGEILEEIAKIECKDDKECKVLQLNINQAFKAWTKGGGMKIFIDIDDESFINDCKNIAQGIGDVDSIMSKYNHSAKNGTVYLAKCMNNKLKIGITTDINRRKEDLKQEERNQVIDIIDTFESTDITQDEAKLHELCDSYKTNSNKEVTWLQEYGNSELFKDCQDVINIWREYKVNHDIRNNHVTM